MYLPIFHFSTNFGFMAIYCCTVFQPFIVAFGYIRDVHWTELTGPQHWAGVTACHPKSNGDMV